MPADYTTPVTGAEGTAPPAPRAETSEFSSTSDLERSTTVEKTQTQHSEGGLPQAEVIRTISRVPGNPNYYEKDGLRTYGDGEDHDTDVPMNFTRFMALAAMGFLWCGSQIPIYLFGGCIVIVYTDLGGSDRYSWAILGNLLALAAVTPFVGQMSDMFGRRWVAVIGSVLIIIGMIISSVAPNMNIFIMGMVFAGAGGGICELTALAATGELVPTKQRGLYVGLVIATILPFCPSVLWAQLIATVSWRYNGLFCALWAFVGLILILFFYFPPPRVNGAGLTKKEQLGRIDFTGALLSISGLVLFLAALQWGGAQYPWSSAHVLAPLIIGIVLLAAFAIWEWKFAKFPMFPARLKKDPRNLYLILFITAVSGANFFAILVFWPTQSYSMYDPDPINVGIRSLPIGFGIILGAIIIGILITVLNGKIRLLLTFSCVIMTAGTGCMALARRDNINDIYAPLCFAALGVGGVIIPNQIIITIICPDDLIATSTALALTVRVIGGSIGYAVYYNVFKQRFTYYATEYFGTAASSAGVYDINDIQEMAYLISANLYQDLLKFPQVKDQATYDALYFAGRETFALAWPIVWYAAIAFGGATIIACLFLKDIAKYMDGHIAVRL